MSACQKSASLRRRAAGFTVVELAVSLLVMVVVMLGMLALFDFSNRLANVQTNVADMQQSQRIAQQDVVRMVRMAARGPIPLGLPPVGMSLSVRSQVPAGTRIGGSDTPEVLAGTDILTVRGVFGSSVYQVNSSNPAAFAVGADLTGHIDIENLTPSSIPQDLQSLKDALDNARQDDRKCERLLLVSARNLDMWSIVALDPAGSTVTATSAHLKFTSLPADDPAYFDLPAVPDPRTLSAVAFVGILEEHRFYVRQALPKTAPNGTQDLASQFSRARVFPGTDRPWRGLGDDMGIGDDDHPSWKIDIADNIVDFQVGLAFDSPRGGGRFTDDDPDTTGDDDRIYESADGTDDDWLYNDTEDVDPVQWANLPLFFVRITTLARTDRRDKGYESLELDHLEDHDLATSRFNAGTDRMFRYRPLQTLVDMRNL